MLGTSSERGSEYRRDADEVKSAYDSNHKHMRIMRYLNRAAERAHLPCLPDMFERALKLPPPPWPQSSPAARPLDLVVADRLTTLLLCSDRSGRRAAGAQTCCRCSWIRTQVPQRCVSTLSCSARLVGARAEMPVSEATTASVASSETPNRVCCRPASLHPRLWRPFPRWLTGSRRKRNSILSIGKYSGPTELPLGFASSPLA